MPEFDKRVQAWRSECLRHGSIKPWQVDELEDQLRCSLAAARDCGLDSEQAWCASTRALGSPDHLHTEYNKDRRMTPASKLLGISISLAMLGLVAFTSPGGPLLFVHTPSALFVLAIVAGGLITSFGCVPIARATRLSLASTTVLEPAEVDELIPVFRRGYRLAWMSGAIGLIAGFIQVLANLQDPSQLGSGLATITLMPLYGALLAELLFANAQQWLENRRRPCA